MQMAELDFIAKNGLMGLMVLALFYVGRTVDKLIARHLDALDKIVERLDSQDAKQAADTVKLDSILSHVRRADGADKCDSVYDRKTMP